MEVQRRLIRAYDVGRMLGYSTWTIKKWAKDGRLPGAVFLGNPGRQHIRFDPLAIEDFIQSWRGRRPELPELPKQQEFTIRRHGHRPHAGGPLRADGGQLPMMALLGQGVIEPGPPAPETWRGRDGSPAGV